MKQKYFFTVTFLLVALFVAMNSFQNMKKSGRPDVGGEVPDFTLTSLDKKTSLSPANLKGKVLFINFWASWCKGCRVELPSINNLSKIMAGKKDFQIITIAYKEDPTTSLNYLKKLGYDLPVYPDYSKAWVNFGVTAIPETFIISKSGIVAKVKIGPDRWDSGSNLRLFNSLLEQSPGN